MLHTEVLQAELSVMFSVLSSSLLTSADKDQKGKYSVPILDVKSRELVLDTNQTLQLSCRWVSGRWIQAREPLSGATGVGDPCKWNIPIFKA